MKYKILSGPDNEKDMEINGVPVHLHRIEAERDINCFYADGRQLQIKAGTRGGWIEGEHNLSPFGQCWIGDEAVVCQHARVKMNAAVFENAIVSGDAILDENSIVFGNAHVSGKTEMFGNCWVFGNAEVTGDTVMFGNVIVCENAKAHGVRETNRRGVSRQLIMKGLIMLYGNAELTGASSLTGEISISGSSRIDKCFLDGKIDIYDAQLSHETLKGRYSVHGKDRVAYFEKTRIPRKFILPREQKTSVFSHGEEKKQQEKKNEQSTDTRKNEA